MTSILTATDVKQDTVLVGAVDVARAALVDEVGEAMAGEHIATVMEGERLATHTFACLNPAYVGWQWAVTVARAPRAKTVTISEVILLPGPEALVAPEWVPWSARVQPGDLSPGDVLPTPADDARLVAGLTGADDLESVASRSPLQPGSWEIGLGRVRVLSPIGRDDAADRWVEGEYGPSSAMAKQATLDCTTCGFMLPMDGPMGQQFAVCANEMSPADGHVVALTYGCGAHSEALPSPSETPLAEDPAVVDVVEDVDADVGEDVDADVDADVVEESVEETAPASDADETAPASDADETAPTDDDPAAT